MKHSFNLSCRFYNAQTPSYDGVTGGGDSAPRPHLSCRLHDGIRMSFRHDANPFAAAAMERVYEQH